MRRVVGQLQEEGPALIPLDEVDSGSAEDIGQVLVLVAVFDGPVAVQAIAVIGIPAALEADELLKATRRWMIARVQRAVVPFADQRRRVTGAA